MLKIDCSRMRIVRSRVSLVRKSTFLDRVVVMSVSGTWMGGMENELFLLGLMNCSVGASFD